MDDETIDLDNLSADKIEELLLALGEDLTLSQLLELERFIERIGGVENARLAIDVLREIEKAA